MADIWHETASVRFGSVDRSNRLTLWSIFDLFQEGAISHAADLGVGVDVFARAGQAWILSRLSLFVERRPEYGETVEVRTWPRRWEKLFALRDYEIRDAGGKAAVRGRGGWLVLDSEKRKPLRIEPVLGSLPPNDGIDAFPRTGASPIPTSLGSRENLAKTSERSALFSDIDIYGHVNNARYIQWIQDATDIETLTAADQIRLDINYLSEVKPGETVEIWTAPLAEEVPPEGGEASDYPSRPGPGFAYEGRRREASGFPAGVPGQAVFRAELRTGSA